MSRLWQDVAGRFAARPLGARAVAEVELQATFKPSETSTLVGSIRAASSRVSVDRVDLKAV